MVELNKILRKCIESRNGNYVHAIEVEYSDDIFYCIEAIALEFPDEPKEVIMDFFESMAIYSLSENEFEEDLIYNFDITKAIEEIYGY